MKTLFAILVLYYFSGSLLAQGIGINETGTDPHASAMLDVSSTAKGFLLPRMTTAERDAILSPAAGLQIYNLTTNCLEIYINPNWQNIFCGCTSAPANLSYTDNGPLVYCSNSSITSNSSTTQASIPSSFTVTPSLPAGLQLNNINGQITGTPAASSSAANYTITASNACGSTTRVLNIGVISTLAAPSAISGPSNPTTNTTASYSITASSGAISYTWTVPTDWTINSGQGSTAINVTVGSNTGNVAVTASNACGASNATTKAVIPSFYPVDFVFCASGATTVVNVTNPTTGKIWMDRNLGATQIASSSSDANSFGDLFQWGRRSDGHQCRNSSNTSSLSSIDQPGNGNFIITNSSPYDWRSGQNTNLWQGINGVNNPCPGGYRVPSETELNNERLSWGVNNGTGAFSSPLKWPMAGFRFYVDGQIYAINTNGFYWSSTINSTSSFYLRLETGTATVVAYDRAAGFSVRCIKE